MRTSTGGWTLFVWLAFFLQICLAALFLWSGASKLGSPTGAATAIAALTRLAGASAQRTAMALGGVEAATGLLLLTPPLMRIGSILALSLGTFILVASTYVLRSKQSIGCGCFGTRSTQPIGWKNSLAGCLILVSALLLLYIDEVTSLSRATDPFLSVGIACAVLLVGLEVRNVDLLRRPLANFTLRGA